MARILLHDEIAAILREYGKPWMTVDQIASLVNERGRYQKTSQAKTPDVRPFQIRLRTRNNPHMFETDGDRVGLLRP